MHPHNNGIWILFYCIILILFDSPSLTAQENNDDGYLTIQSNDIWKISIDDSISLESPVTAYPMPAGSHNLRAKRMNEKNWTGLTVHKEFRINAMDTLILSLEPQKYRLLQSIPGDAGIFAINDTLLGKTPLYLNTDIPFNKIYLQKKGYLKNELDLSTVNDWPLMVRLSPEPSGEPSLVTTSRPKNPNGIKRLVKPGLVITAITSNWLSFYLKRIADDHYDSYKSTSNLSDMRRNYNKAKDFDNYSSIALGISAAALSTYLYLLIFD
ncbi:MAG: hypothetical protein AB7W47_01805 [Calditrichaceae bacterium]